MKYLLKVWASFLWHLFGKRRALRAWAGYQVAEKQLRKIEDATLAAGAAPPAELLRQRKERDDAHRAWATAVSWRPL